MKRFLIILLLLTANISSQAAMTSHSNGNFVMQLYTDSDHNATGVELFTKQPSKNVFFGLTCNSMTPFPMFEVILMENDILSETPRYLEANILFNQDKTFSGSLAGILTSTLTADEASNKIRLELSGTKDMNIMNKQYQLLLDAFLTSKSFTATFNHRSFGSESYYFELDGLSSIILNHTELCQ